ncbi:class D sortase [Paenibacillus swuensis]|uniref:class D sortase n=1 Tax=Paenibacillus swuensis TaxID=1178515 RepID=UPI0008381988|nr:class D sortase [Paenibacillus swuensis]
MKYIGIGVVLAGLLLIVYPPFQQAYEDHQQQQLLSSLDDIEMMEDIQEVETAFEAELQSEAKGTVYKDTSLDDVHELKVNQSTKPHGKSSVEVRTVQSHGDNSIGEERLNTSKLSSARAIGIIEIPKIKARLPVLNGVSTANLKLGAAYFEGTALPGSRGNTVIAAHRSYKFGRMFNRLNELSSGDDIQVKTHKGTFTYKVTSTEIVQPEETGVLKQNRSKRTLTLITCHPIRVGTQRLIVHAESA